ncbi:cytochrome b561 and DOMON domain-containing protein At2g04850-like [Hibiscus syriacus]|uniref:cytochrome b561 and DOMON domain-containing protein At2g04850-like n=1 Tax=Hibiscus syriacus TaxID=106335 RepID=UPI0019227547|nr:cytochrome b561 and DOMON domain-containing protein At2g04850-like [Hibiscus syriacus]
MTGTCALVAFLDPNSGQLVLLPYILDPSVKLQKSLLLSRLLDIHLISSATLYGGKMATIHNGATVKLVPNNTKIHHVWNRGLYVQGYSPTIHPTTSNELSSKTTFDVLSGSAAKQHNNMDMMKLVHGILNAISWGILLPMGAVTARYLRHK